MSIRYAKHMISSKAIEFIMPLQARNCDQVGHTYQIDNQMADEANKLLTKLQRRSDETCEYLQSSFIRMRQQESLHLIYDYFQQTESVKSGIQNNKELSSNEAIDISDRTKALKLMLMFQQEAHFQ